MPSLRWEQKLARQGFSAVAGVDEAGRGPLAGPVVAAAVILPPGWVDPGVQDSKRLSARQRLHLDCLLRQHTNFALGMVNAQEIDRLNIHHASLLAMARAAAALAPDYLLIDGRFALPALKIPQQTLVKGDNACCSIAAASILAKVLRDKLMYQLHQRYPVYDFAANKGYPTGGHRLALQKYGPCPQHRRSYAPVAAAAGAPGDDWPRAFNKGKKAEDAATAYLRQLGYRIAGRNLRLASGELDIVAYDGAALVFVEVKAGASRGWRQCLEAIDRHKRKRLLAAAAAYIAENMIDALCRFDVVAVDLSREPYSCQLWRDAFRVEDAENG
jgi:ribonuclease HII